MRILLHSYHRRSKAEFRVTNFALELSKRGHDVTVLCISEKAKIGMQVTHENGVTFVEAPDLFSGPLRSSWDPWDAFNRALFLRDKKFDITHIFETRPAVIYPTLFQLARNRSALVIDWSDWWGRGGLIQYQRPQWYQNLFEGFETYFEENFRTRAIGTTVISRALKGRAIQLGVEESSIFQIPNGTRCDGIEVISPKQFRKKFEIPEDYFVMCDSAHDVLMGVDLIFKALKEIVKEHPKTMYFMTGRHKPRLEKMAQSIGVEKHFRHFGFVPMADLNALFSCTDIFSIPYIYNNANLGRWPGRVGNYLPHGRPIVSNPVGEMKVLVEENEIGLLAEEQPKDFANKVLSLIRDPELRRQFGANARSLAENDLRWEKMTDRLENCYEKTLAKSTHPYPSQRGVASKLP